MNNVTKSLLAGVGTMMVSGLMAGCIVREERPHPVYYEREAPPPVVVQEEQPADVVEVVPAAPGPEYIYVRGYWFRERGHWVWRHGYWNHR